MAGDVKKYLLLSSAFSDDKSITKISEVTLSCPTPSPLRLLSSSFILPALWCRPSLAHHPFAPPFLCRDTMIAMGVACDGGKDSLSMAAAAGGETVMAPGNLVVSAYVGCPDITQV